MKQASLASITSLILGIAVGVGCAASLKRSTTIDETERLRAATISSVEQIVKPTPVQIETTAPDGQKTTITTAPQSTTTHNLTDNTTASSSAFFSSKVSMGLGVSVIGNLALLLIAYVLYSRFTAQGRVVDRALAYAARRATSINNAERREELMHMRDILSSNGK